MQIVRTVLSTHVILKRFPGTTDVTLTKTYGDSVGLPLSFPRNTSFFSLSRDYKHHTGERNFTRFGN